MDTMDTVRQFFDRAPQFTQLGKAMAEFSRADFHQPLQPANFLSFVQRDSGDLDEESILEYCRLHLDRAGLWNLGLELEVRTCWRMSGVMNYWHGLLQGSQQHSFAASEAA